MSIATELSKLANNKTAIKAAIEAKDPPVMPTDNLSQWPTSIASLPGSQQLSDKLDAEAAAAKFNTASTYAVDDIVVYNGKRYRCTTAVETAGEWTGSTNWTEETIQTAINNIDVSSQIQGKLDSTSAAPAFDSTATYFVNDYVTYLGTLYRCKVAVTTAGAWTGSTNWEAVDMTTPDATLDITSGGKLRVVAADGTILWQQGYDLKTTSSATMSNESVNLYSFTANDSSVVTLAMPTAPSGKVGDFVLDVSNPALDDTAATWPAAFSNQSTYAVGDKVSYDSKIWKCTVAVDPSGAWTGTDNWAEAYPGFSISGLDNTVGIVVPSGEDLGDMLTFAPGTMCELYFTQTAFNLNTKPTWKVVRQDVVDGGGV